MNTSTFVTSRKELLDRTSPLPAYQQIANDIVLRISQQEWQIDDKLPSEAELAADYGVSRVTLRQAMGQLEQEGIIARFQGKGAFVTNNPRQLVQELTFPSLDSTNKRSVKSKVLLMEQEKIGKFIASCRKEQGFTQAVLAEKLGITDRAVSKWETGVSHS